MSDIISQTPQVVRLWTVHAMALSGIVLDILSHPSAILLHVALGVVALGLSIGGIGGGIRRGLFLVRGLFNLGE